MMDIFAPYAHAIASLAIWPLIITVLSMVATRGLTPENRTESGQPRRNYDDRAYRAHRAFMNALEASGPFIAAVLAAILSGASPVWVNIFASVFIVSRIAVAFVHIGTTNQPMRSLVWMVGLISILGLVVMALMAVL
ncbi:MAG: MAPEG family protein [Aestuariivita sp.]|uniref:MAPEG family protein n=1 Tax=Aestuariivita sp. TaxID=1872407 RepID=UPI003BB01F52